MTPPLRRPANVETESKSLVSKDTKISISKQAQSLDMNRIDLQWKNITYNADNGTSILKGLSGTSYSGELTAIMGPSGSGKTSLINVLSGFTQKRVSGQVIVNGTLREMVSFRKLTCYIFQDSHILPQFTVRELITFASNLKISSVVHEKEKQKAVDDCIYGLGLVGQQHQRANTLSGGQMKRLCVAQEIVNNPPVIFLDEPTSGLDSSSCLQCVQLLKSLAEGGRNVICTIHQPSSKIFEIFDNLYMLSEGDCIYRGPTKDLLTYLDNQGLKCPKYHSPTDFLTDIALGFYGEWNSRLKRVIKTSFDNENDKGHDEYSDNQCKNALITFMMSLTKSKLTQSQDNWQKINKYSYPTSNWNQFQELFKRRFIDMIRDPMHMKLKLISGILIGLLMGTLFYDTGNDASRLPNTMGLLQTHMIIIMILAKIPTVLTFPLQRTIFEREHFNGWYNVKMYYLATTAAEIPLQVIYPMISCGLIYWLAGHPLEISRVSLFMLTGTLLALIAFSMGLMIGAVCNVQNGITVASVLFGCSMVFSGGVVTPHMAPGCMRWLFHCMYNKHALQALVLSLYMDRSSFQCREGFCLYKNPTQLMKQMHMGGDIITEYCALFGFFVIYLVCSYLLLNFRVSRMT